GQGPGGGTPGLLPAIFSGDGGGAPGSFATLTPLYGGAGGGGGVGTTTQNGPAGAGGGGAIVIASTTQITIQATGSATANGGAGLTPCIWTGAGAGGGGAVRLVAPSVTNQGTVQAKGGNASCVGGGGYGYTGRIRIECSTCSVGTTDPVASVSNTLGPITAASTPPLVSLPTLLISTVGGVAVPASAAGSHAAPDLTIPATTTNPMNVTLIANNVPVPTQFVVKVIPAFAEPLFFPSTFSTGSFATSTAIARLPPGQVSVLTAFASFTQVAGLFPLLDGEPVEQVLVAASVGEPSSVMLITKSGKEVRLDQLALEAQVRLAQAFDALAKEP
ncbi:MAG: hypothetical protein ACRD88_01870, partial [Terriglobia bacterium]